MSNIPLINPLVNTKLLSNVIWLYTASIANLVLAIADCTNLKASLYIPSTNILVVKDSSPRALFISSITVEPLPSAT